MAGHGAGRRDVGRPRRARPVVAAWALASLAAMVACGEPPPVGPVPPTAELLVAAGDSTWWIRADSSGLSVRAAPLLVARTDGRWYELFVQEDVADFERAEFVSEVLWRRDLATGDSAPLLEDPSVDDTRAQWEAAHPDALPVDPEELDLPDPATSAIASVDVLDVHGPYVSWRQSVDIDVEDEPGHRHERRYGVLDLRTAQRVTLQDVFTAETASRLARSNRAHADALLQALRTSGDVRARDARQFLDAFTRDEPDAFTLAAQDGEPLVHFRMVAAGPEDAPVELPVPPLPAGETPGGWDAVRPTLPTWSRDSSQVRWTGARVMLQGIVTRDRQQILLRLAAAPSVDTGAVAAVWDVGVVPFPLYQVLAVDSSASPSTRAALARAFDRATATDRSLAWRPASPARSPRFHRAFRRVE